MSRYKAAAVIPMSRKEKLSARISAPETLRFMACEGRVWTFEVSAHRAEEAYEKALSVVSRSPHKGAVLRPVSERDRLADTVETITSDEDLHFLGFSCIGKLEVVYPELGEAIHDELYRTWIWEDESGKRIASWDTGNGFCSYLCGGTESEVQDYWHRRIGDGSAPEEKR